MVIKNIKIVIIVMISLMITLSLYFYNKINYPLPQDTVMISKNGNLMWYNRPAISSRGDSLFAAWMTADRRVVIGEIEKETGVLLDKVYLHQWHYLNDHGAPIVHVIEDGMHKGKLISIYNLHNSDIYFQRTINNTDLMRWEGKKVINKCECTYPTLLEINHVLYLFYRKVTDSKIMKRSYYVKTSSDFGDTWADEKEVISAIEGEWIYAMVEKGNDNSIHIAWGVFSPSFNDIKNIFYATSKNRGVTWTSINNNKEVNVLESSKEYLVRSSSPNVATRIWDFRVNDAGDVALLSVDYDSNYAEAHWIGRSNGRWLTVDLGENSREYYPCGLTFKGDSNNKVYISKYQKNGVSGLYEMTIDPSLARWSQSYHIKNNSKYSYCRPVSSHSFSGVLFTMVKSYKHYMDFDTSLISFQR